MADTAGATGKSWERELMLESLESYRRGLCEAPIIHKWSFSTGEGSEGTGEGRGRAEAHREGNGTAAIGPKGKDCEASGEGEPMTFVLSTEEVDRHGDVIAASGWHLDSYSRNPVFLWAHDYARPVIGKASEVWKESHSLLARVEFAPTAFAQEIASLYRAGFQRGVSVGFKPLRYEERRHEKTGALLGLRFLEQELLETSAVPVPSNRSALRRALEEVPLTKGYFQMAARSLGDDPRRGAGEYGSTGTGQLSGHGYVLRQEAGEELSVAELLRTEFPWTEPPWAEPPWTELAARLDDLEELACELVRMVDRVEQGARRGASSEEVEQVLKALRSGVR